MAAMNPILRLRRAFRSLGVEADQADQAADAVDQHTYSRSESDQRFQQMLAEFRSDMAELRRDMAELRTQLLLGMLGIGALMTTIITIAIAVFT